MRIQIDTKEDSYEDIKKVIKMLQHLVGEQPATNQPNIFDDSETSNKTDGNVFGNMFETHPPTEDQQEKKEDNPVEIIPY